MDYLQKLRDRTGEVFEGQEQATQWLNTPNRGLSDKKPMDLAKTEAGLSEVLQLLGRIEHGIFS